MPLTMAMTWSPLRNGRSARIVSAMRAVISRGGQQGHALAARLAVDADAHLHLVLAQLEGGFAGRGHGAGGQGHPHGTPVPVDLAAERFHARQIVAALGRRAADLLRQHGRPHAAAAGRVKAVFHGNVVVDDHRPHVYAPAWQSSAAISKFMMSPV